MALMVLGQLPGTGTVTPRLWRINAPITRFWRKSRKSDRHLSREQKCYAGIFGDHGEYGRVILKDFYSWRVPYSACLI